LDQRQLAERLLAQAKRIKESNPGSAVGGHMLSLDFGFELRKCR
jgi:hypothetical protein